MKAKMTITRALAELKLLQKRINNGTNELAVIGIIQNGKMQSPYNSMDKAAFEEKAKAGLQSVEDLIARMTAIKTAIDQSNSTTKVKIGSSEMTVQEALVEKSLISYKKALLTQLKALKNRANRDFENLANRVTSEIDSLRESLSTSKDSDKTTIEKICSDTLEVKYPQLVDPCDLSKKIEALEAAIEDFENNVDYALSESNSVTYIEV